MLEETLKSPLDSKEIKSVNPKGNQPWIFIGRTDDEAEGEAPGLWPPDVKSQLIEKTLMLGKIEGTRRRGQHRLRWLDSITGWIDMNLSKLWEIVEDRRAWYATVHGSQRARHNLVTEHQPHGSHEGYLYLLASSCVCSVWSPSRSEERDEWGPAFVPRFPAVRLLGLLYPSIHESQLFSRYGLYTFSPSRF